MQLQHYRSATICLELHNKVTIAPPKDITEIANESVYGTHLRMLFKMDLRVQMDAKSGQLKIERISSGVAPKSELQYLYT